MGGAADRGREAPRDAGAEPRDRGHGSHRGRTEADAAAGAREAEGREGELRDRGPLAITSAGEPSRAPPLTPTRAHQPEAASSKGKGEDTDSKRRMEHAHSLVSHRACAHVPGAPGGRSGEAGRERGRGGQVCVRETSAP